MAREYHFFFQEFTRLDYLMKKSRTMSAGVTALTETSGHAIFPVTSESSGSDKGKP
jgi:hypothetical protein